MVVFKVSWVSKLDSGKDWKRYGETITMVASRTDPNSLVLGIKGWLWLGEASKGDILLKTKEFGPFHTPQ